MIDKNFFLPGCTSADRVSSELSPSPAASAEGHGTDSLEVDVREVIWAVLVSQAMMRMLRVSTDVGSELGLGVGTEGGVTLQGEGLGWVKAVVVVVEWT